MQRHWPAILALGDKLLGQAPLSPKREAPGGGQSMWPGSGGPDSGNISCGSTTSMVAAVSAVRAVISGAYQALWALWAASDPRQRQAQVPVLERAPVLRSRSNSQPGLSPRSTGQGTSIQIPDFLDHCLGTCRRDLQQLRWDAADLGVVLRLFLSYSSNSARVR